MSISLIRLRTNTIHQTREAIKKHKSMVDQKNEHRNTQNVNIRPGIGFDGRMAYIN